MHGLVSTLIHLNPNVLHARADAAARRQAGAAWELAACLVAMEKSESFRAFDCTSAVDYAERKLGLGPGKALELLRGGRILERFPKLSEACRDGRLCWSKLRELGRVVQPETEEQWLAFAITHTTREVERAVAVAPAQFRREQAAVSARVTAECLQTAASTRAAVAGEQAAASTRAAVAGEQAAASTRTAVAGEQAAISTRAAVAGEETAASTRAGVEGGQSPDARTEQSAREPAEMQQAPQPEAKPSPLTSQAQPSISLARADAPLAARAAPDAPGFTGPAARPALPSAPVPARLVKVEMYLTPDQFAIWDTALNRVRSEKSRHVAKEIALETLARHYLAGGDARTRANHPVVLRADPATGSTWYETSRGVLPASAEAVEDALARENGTFVEIPDAAPPSDARPGDAATTPAESAVDSGSTRPPTQLPRPGNPPRKPISAARRRALLARAKGRCERCGATSRLEVDHVTAVCDGGADLDLQVLCHACHAYKHAEDFASDPRYVAGRATGMARCGARQARGAPQDDDARTIGDATLQAATSG